MQGKREESILRTAIEIPVSSLSTQDQQSTNRGIDSDAHRAWVPYHRITNEVNLTMVLDPKVLQQQRETHQTLTMIRNNPPNLRYLDEGEAKSRAESQKCVDLSSLHS